MHEVQTKALSSTELRLRRLLQLFQTQTIKSIHVKKLLNVHIEVMGEGKSVQSACFYTAPWQIGKKIVEAFDEVAKAKGFEGTMKKRHVGLSSGSASTRAP